MILHDIRSMLIQEAANRPKLIGKEKAVFTWAKRNYKEFALKLGDLMLTDLIIDSQVKALADVQVKYNLVPGKFRDDIAGIYHYAKKTLRFQR